MTWLLAVVLRPFGALVMFGASAFIAYKLLYPLIPDGRIKTLLYDRTIRTQHPWKFGTAVVVSCYGTIFLMVWLYS